MRHSAIYIKVCIFNRFLVRLPTDSNLFSGKKHIDIKMYNIVNSDN